MLQRNKLSHRILSILMILFITFSAVPYRSASAQGDDGVKRERNAETGKINFIGGERGRPVKAADALGIPAERVRENPGRAWIQKYASEFGLRNPGKDLKEQHSALRENGRLNVRYQQTYEDIPVFAGGLIVNTDEAGDLYSITGEVSSDIKLSIEPRISMEDAQNHALQVVARNYEGATEEFVSSQPELWIYDESLVTAGDRHPVLVWKMEITPVDGARPIRELILVDAVAGRVALNYNQVDTAWHASANASTTKPAGASAPLFDYPNPTEPFGATRTTYDAQNNRAAGDDVVACSNQLLGCTGGTDPDADAAHLYAGLVWSLYKDKHGRNSINNGAAPGMTIVSRVHYDSGYANAFWNGVQMTYGDGYGFANADDVVAHEITHGVTEYESNLVYFYQSGAINESLSDVWGEYFDQTNNSGTDTNAVKWLIGEDVTELGALRSMSNPPAFGDPDRMLSSLFYKGEGDNGGVHINSGVNNKAVYLMVDGGIFNGKTVNGIGWDKTAAIYYEAQTNLLGNGANYSDLYYALLQACSTLTGGAQGITLDNCVNVRLALDAVQMNSPINLKHELTAPLCPAGLVPDDAMVFQDKMEGALTTNWTLTNQFGGPSTRWQPSTFIASSPSHSAWGETPLFQNIVLDEKMSMTTAEVIPPNAYLHFDHAFDFDYFGSSYYDGGVLEYSKNGGATWVDAAPLFSAGANYRGTVSSAFGNALGGRRAFAGSSFSYYSFFYEYYYGFPAEAVSLVSSRYNLSSLAGESVQFRFRFATDDLIEFLGWYIDDVKIYTCVGTPAIPVLQSPANNALVTDYTPLLNWGDSAPAIDNYQVQVATSNTFASPIVNVSNILVSEYTLPTLDENTTHYWRVRAFNSEDVTNNWSAARSFRTVLLPPVPVTPANGSSPMTPRPTFTWTNPNDDGPAPTSYTIQISPNSNFAPPIVHTGTATTTSYTPAGNLPSGVQLYWRLRANGVNGPSAYSSATMSFFTPGTPPPAPTLTLPANGVLTIDYSPALSWTIGALPGGTTVDHYQIHIDDDPAFGSPNNYNPAGAGTTFSPAPDLASNTKWYWRVRAHNNLAEIGPWSAVRNFRTALVPPTLTTPVDNATVTSLRPTFDWNDVTGATGYTIQISLNSSFAPLQHTGNPVGSTYTPTVDLPKNTTLYWRVLTKGLNGPSAWAPAVAADRTFTTPVNPPAAPTLTSPASNFLTTDYSPALSWTMPATSPAFDHFIVQVDNNIDFSSPEEEHTTVPSSPFSPSPDLASNTRFYWRVRAVNLAGEMGNWSAVRNFRTALQVPILQAPSNGYVLNTFWPLFNWADVPGAAGYNIQISWNNTFTQIATNANTTTSVYQSISGFCSSTLYWRVRATGANGPSNWSSTYSFTVPSCP